MTTPAGSFAPFAERMRREQLPDIVVRTFEHYYRQLADGQTGLIPEKFIQPVDELPASADFTPEMYEAGRAALPHAILLKLNGGLGTGMGLAKAKSLLPIKDGLTFLDIIARQAQDGGVPLVLMNSFSTQADSLAALGAYPGLRSEIPLDFLQHKVPKILQADLAPAAWPEDPELEWCPPGHGDIYTALVTSGMLDQLLAGGYKYAFVSNADNLGAVMDEGLLGYFASRHLPFMMEVAPRTEADKKGGHLAQLPNGQFVLRELAQCPSEDEASFQNIRRHRFFNTNNLWINLPALKMLLDQQDGILGLAMIRNAKTLDPRDRKSPPVVQLETAMGSAIEVFPGSGAVLIPQNRFAPIKKTNDLLDVRSDNYILTEDFLVTGNPARTLERAFIDLDPEFYQFVDDFDARFPLGAPSLLECSRFVVRGDVRFGKDVVVRGEVEVVNETGAAVTVADGTVLQGRVEF
jgi:UTP--glucose-1-phosphate uridylyltransferase